MLPRVFLVLAAASLPQLCSSAPPEVENFDPKCPAPIFFNRTASFFHSEWYTGPLLSSTGRDNTVGATRSGNFSGTLFTERLVEFSKTSDKVVHRFVLDNGPIRVGNLVIGSYTEGMEVLSICGGAATWFGFTDLLCANSGPGVFNPQEMQQRLERLLCDPFCIWSQLELDITSFQMVESLAKAVSISRQRSLSLSKGVDRALVLETYE